MCHFQRTKLTSLDKKIALIDKVVKTNFERAINHISTESCPPPKCSRQSLSQKLLPCRSSSANSE